jgi:hypothetical protein
MSELTESQYVAAIPPWCAYQTIEQHKAMMLCWGLTSLLERGERCLRSDCEGCELYKPKTGEGTC